MARTSWSVCLRHLLAARRWTALALTVPLLLLLIHQTILPLLVLLFPALEPTFFDLGLYGAYPSQHFATFPLCAPQPKHIRWNEKCDNGLILMTPNGPSVERPGPMILDSKGELVWMSDDFGTTANLKVQNYKNESYLTLWSGEKAATSGSGVYFMIDSTYQVAHMVSAVGDDLFGDLHEFKITNDDTALITVYNKTTADLTGMGRGRGPNGWIVDNLFQEIDIETGELLFQWRASDHFNPTDTYMTNPLGGYWESIPFDWYHLNSIDKDAHGNYIISSRHFHSVTAISPVGEILWILGGRDNEFQDLSDGQATNFKWQHDARWFSEAEGILTLFDNSKAGPLHIDAPSSRALFIQLDIPNRTARLVQSLTSLGGILASSQGSVQTSLDNDQTFVGWGSAAAYSEYSQDGELLCETHLGASWFYWLERMKSYRTTKTYDWHAMPRDAPQVKIEDGHLLVSWNGATDVASWSLEMAHSVEEGQQTDEHLRGLGDATEHSPGSGKFQNIDILPKSGFEGSFDLPAMSASKKAYARYRVAALDASRHVLRYSEIIAHNDDSSESSTLVMIFKLFLILGFLVGVSFIFKHYQASARAHAQGYSVLAPPTWMEWNGPSSWSTRRRFSSATYAWLQARWRRMAERPD
ncbi:hypothetical protein AC578_9942 [Lecanosticta acicola]|uniref:ASST-domain-containing protein n=1 Tax=Lecanosticta acicola TaxID=111012 RepID=A0AAI8YVC8_9PEZI|nr:hypothetical protein AC578_9942 [Lecanosticta acicola]